MAIKFTCDCGKALQVAEKFAGKNAKCPGCAKTVRVPEEEGAVTAKAPPVLPNQAAASSSAKAAPWEKPKAKPKPPPMPDEDDDEKILELCTHAGAPIEDDDDFFAEAPRAIGEVISSFTTLKKHKRPRPIALRAAVGVAVAFVCFVLIAGCVAVLRMPLRFIADDVAFIIVIPGLISAFLGVVGFFVTGFRHSCTYVGAKGIAWFECTSTRDHLKREDVFLFKNAADLRTSQTRHYYNGIYTGTQYSYIWSDEKGKKVYTLSGQYRSEAGTPKVSDPYYFAHAAENAWSQYLLANIDALTDEDGLIFFALTKGNSVELGKNLFVLKQGGATIELEADDIESVNINDGIVYVKEVGGKQGWFSNTGVHQFTYADLGNAQFFLFAMNRLLGIQL